MKIKLLLLPILISMIFLACSKKEEETKFYGNIDLRTVSLGHRVSGKIKNIYFDEGQFVKKDDLIVELDDDIYNEALKEIQAQIKVQESNILKLKKGYRIEEIQKAKASYEKSLVELKKSKKIMKDSKNYTIVNQSQSKPLKTINLLMKFQKHKLHTLKVP